MNVPNTLWNGFIKASNGSNKANGLSSQKRHVMAIPRAFIGHNRYWTVLTHYAVCSGYNEVCYGCNKANNTKNHVISKTTHEMAKTKNLKEILKYAMSVI